MTFLIGTKKRSFWGVRKPLFWGPWTPPGGINTPQMGSQLKDRLKCRSGGPETPFFGGSWNPKDRLKCRSEGSKTPFFGGLTPKNCNFSIFCRADPPEIGGPIELPAKVPLWAIFSGVKTIKSRFPRLSHCPPNRPPRKPRGGYVFFGGPNWKSSG